MTHAIIPGSFDPITLGHLDIIKRACALYDRVTVVIAINADKEYAFSKEERIMLAKDAVKDLKNADVDSTDGLLVDYAAAAGFPVIIKGLRNKTDFQYELKMVQINEELSEKRHSRRVFTMFMPATKNLSRISSSYVKKLLANGKSCKKFVPNEELLKKLYKKRP